MTELPERLRSAADAYRPDRERILARVEHAMAADGAAEPEARGHDRPAAAPWMRVTAVTAAVAGAIGIGGLAVGAVTANQPSRSVVTTDGSDSPQSSPSASGGSHSSDGRVPVQRPSGTAPAHRPGATPHTSAGRTEPASPPLQAPPPSVPGSSPQSSGSPGAGGSAPQSSGPLQSNGAVDASSNSYWAQSNVVLTTQQPLTSLTAELRIARVSGETEAGSWTSAPQTTVQVTTESGWIVYRWTLNSGQTLPAGTYTFAGQFKHDEGQGGTDGDSYTVTATYGSGSSATVSGGF
ncbi:MAG: hypothetical protein HOY69_23240 [Streptomyces sp.]|nr:hypothetical protein [Streptomyces sp.]